MSSVNRLRGPVTQSHLSVTVSEPTEEEQKEQCDAFLQSFKIFVLQAGIGKARCDVFKKQIQNNGGVYKEKYDSSVTHIVVDEKMEYDRMCRIIKVEKMPPSVKIVNSLWLSSCLKEKSVANISDYELVASRNSPVTVPKLKEVKPSFVVNKSETSAPLASTVAADPVIREPSASTVKEENNDTSKYPKVGGMFRFHKKVKLDNVEQSDCDSDYMPSGDEDTAQDEEHVEESLTPAWTLVKKPPPQEKWVCAQASSSKAINHNAHITEKLESLARVYENTNDKWRALGYQKAISALKKHPKQITTYEEALAVPGVGSRLANKVWEIIESGQLRKLDELSSSEELKSLDIFMNIWGAGAATARAWVQQGFRTLDDLREKGNLTRHQKIGLMYYDDLLDRMSRSEAAEIEAKVQQAAHSVNPSLICVTCGSYRRGKATCGDVDVLITHPDGKSHKHVFHKILNKLRDSGFLTDDLVSQEENGNQKKYMGVCLLSHPGAKHRRLDIIVVPYDEYACALMYFTGSAHFNRSMRSLAIKMGMSLSEHALMVGVIRNRGEKLNKGTPVPTPTEESVFQHLGLPYRPPSERDH